MCKNFISLAFSAAPDELLVQRISLDIFARATTNRLCIDRQRSSGKASVSMLQIILRIYFRALAELSTKSSVSQTTEMETKHQFWQLIQSKKREPSLTVSNMKDISLQDL